jgi:hypothetical protein
VLSTRGFSGTWIDWIKMLVVGGSVSVMSNGEVSIVPSKQETASGSGTPIPFAV